MVSGWGLPVRFVSSPCCPLQDLAGCLGSLSRNHMVTADMPNVRKLNLHGSASAEADSKRRAWCFFAEPRRDSTPAACAMFTLGRTFPESGNGNREHMLWDFQQVCTPEEGGVAPAASGSASESSLVLQRSLRSRFKTPRKRLWMR